MQKEKPIKQSTSSNIMSMNNKVKYPPKECNNFEWKYISFIGFNIFYEVFFIHP